MAKMGKSFSGGLGQKAERSTKGHFGVWMCVRDWIEEEMVQCGVGPRQLACFRYEEKTKTFQFYGTNIDVKLVSDEAIARGRLKEESFLALLPRAHHEPSPSLYFFLSLYCSMILPNTFL